MVDVANNEASELVGTTFAFYEILAEHASGSSSTIYKARLKKTGTDVALKIFKNSDLFPGYGRWQREARTLTDSARTLAHPLVVQMVDLGLAEKRDYLALEFINGKTLSEHLQTEPRRMEPAAATALFTDLCDGVAHLHSKGIIHSGLNASEIILVTAEGVTRPKIIDLGSAQRVFGDEKSAREDQALANGPRNPHQYLCQEQQKGGIADESWDVFALGCILYEALTGIRYDADSGVPIDDIPEALRSVVLRSTEKEKRKRCTLSDMRAGLNT